MLHIIRKLGTYGITADKLKDVAGDTKRSLKHTSHVEIIYEILRVRKMEERFERGEVDANMVVYTMNRGPSPKGDEEDDSATSVTIEEPEHINQRLMTPISSFQQASTSLATPLDNIPSLSSLPESFSMAEPLNFENPPPQDRPYYITSLQYSDSFSPPMLKPLVTAEIISPNDLSVPAFDYSAHNTYSDSTTDQRVGRSGHYDTRTQSFFTPVNYLTSATSQGMPQPSIHYQMPMVSYMRHMSHYHAQQPDMDPHNRDPDLSERDRWTTRTLTA